MNYLEAVRNVVIVAGTSATAAAIFKHVSERKNMRKTETVRRLVAVCGASRSSVVATLRELEARGFGKLVVGRRGHESRFEWAVE